MPAPPAARGAARSAAVVTVCLAGAQVLGFILQALAAALFGAGPEMDALVAAQTLPQYIIAVLLGGVAFAIVPVFAERRAAGREDEAWRTASDLVNAGMVLLLALAALGMLFARPLLLVAAPGLDAERLELAVRLSYWTWPVLAVSGCVTILTALHQASQSFTRPAAAPLAGSLLAIVMLPPLAAPFGITALAAAYVASLLLQALLLLPLLSGGRCRLGFDARNPGLRRVLALLAPLVLSGVLVRATPVVDRFIASEFEAGSLARLGYAFRLISVAALFISSGLASVLFPRMAIEEGAGDRAALRRTIATGLRAIWLAVAPALALGIALAPDLVAVLFERGRFTPEDTAIVARLLRIYLPALVGMCLAEITGRTMYALSDTRTPAVVGSLEALVYALYAPWLGRRFGLDGVAAAFVVFYSVSLAWQWVVVRRRLGSFAENALARSFATTAAAAVLAGFAARQAGLLLACPWSGLVVAGGGGLLLYALLLLLLRSPDAGGAWNRIAAIRKGRAS